MRVHRIVLLLIAILLLAVACTPPPTEEPTPINDPTESAPDAEPTEATEEPTEPPPALPTSGPDSLSERSTEMGLFTLVSTDPLIEAHEGGEWAGPLQNSGAVFYHEGQFHMFHNGYPSLPGNAVIGYSTSEDGIYWTHHTEEPILRTEDVTYAPAMIMAASAIVADDGTWMLYFLIWDDADVPGAIGRATAPAPTGPWTPDPEPILTRGEAYTWDDAHVTHPSVLRNPAGDGYLMYYTGVDTNEIERVGLATSPDGATWTKYDNPTTLSVPYHQSDPVLDLGPGGAWDGKTSARGLVTHTPEGYAMLYRADSPVRGFDYGIAVSADGLHWARVGDEPVVTRDDLTSGGTLFFPSFTYHDGTFYFFIESFSRDSSIYLFTFEGPLDVATLAGRESIYSAVSVTAADEGNRGNSADVVVRFDGSAGGADLDEYRVMLVKEGDGGSFSASTAASVPASGYQSVSAAISTTQVRLSEGMTDVDGDPITEEVSYVAYVLSVGPEDVLSPPSEAFTLKNQTVVYTLVNPLPAATGGVDVDADGNVYVGNMGRAPARHGGEVYRISPEGVVEIFAAGQGLDGASGNTFDADGNLIQSSFSGDTLHRISPDGTVTTIASETLDGPVGVVATNDGTLYVVNCGDKSVSQITPDGEESIFVESGLFACPNGITIDGAGNLYVLNFQGGRIIKVTPNGEATDFASVPGGQGGHIWYHNDLLYVVGRGAHMIFTVTLTGDVRPFAGSGDRGHDNGSALQATFSLPNDIAISPDGQRFYVNEVAGVNDSANIPSVIRVIELARDEGE